MNRDQPPDVLTQLAGELQLVPLDPLEFYPAFLTLAVEKLGCVAGMVLLRDGEGLRPVADAGFLTSIRAEGMSPWLQANLKVVQDTFVSERPHWMPELFSQAPLFNRWDHALLLPIAGQHGVAELVFTEPLQLAITGERFVGTLIGLASLPFAPESSPDVAPPAALIPAEPEPVPESGAVSRTDGFGEEVIELSRNLQRSLRVREVAGMAVNELVRLLPADRATVLMLRGRKWIPLESSGVEKIHERANLVQSLEQLVRAVLPGGSTFAYPEDAEKLTPSGEKTLAEFVQLAQSARFLIIPLFQPAPLLLPEDVGDEPPLRQPDPVLRGALVVETGRLQPAAPDWRQRSELLARQIEAPLCNAEQYQRLPLRFVWTFLGEMQDWLKGRRLIQVSLILAALVLVGVFLSLFPWTYHVSGDGELLPVQQQYIFAPFDGEVLEVNTGTGDSVTRGQKLLRLRNDALETELVELTSQKQLKLAQVETLQVRRENIRRSGTREELTQIQGEIEAALIEIRGATEQLALLEQRRAESYVTAPQAGVITTFQPRQLLQNRAVSRGEILLEVMDDSQGWRLELTIEEGRLGHILEAMAEQDNQSLPVEFFLATEPETTYSGRLQLLAVRPQTDPEAGSVLEVFVSIPEDQRFHKRIGASVKARIDCGSKPLGYVLFGDFIEFFQRRFWL